MGITRRQLLAGSLTAGMLALLRPGGPFLLQIVHPDAWMVFAYGPLFLHHFRPQPERWVARLQAAGLQVVEQGTTPGSYYFLARKP